MSWRVRMLVALIALAPACELDPAEERQQCAPQPDAGPGAKCMPIPCCALDGEVALCPPEGTWCRNCKTGDTLCCGQGCSR